MSVIDISERKYSDKYGQLCQELPVILFGERQVAKGKLHEDVLKQALIDLLREEQTN